MSLTEAGADASFTDFVRERSNRLHDVAWLVTRNADDARDAVQDALAGLYRHWSRLPSGDEFEAYVHRTVVNACLSVIRRRPRSLPVADPAGLRSAPVSPDGVDALAASDEVWRLCGQLSAVQRTAVVLRFYEDLSFADIAEAMGCREATARSHVTSRDGPATGAPHGGTAVMDDLERTFREGLRAAVATKPPLGAIDLDEVTAAKSGAARHQPQRWLALAAAVVLAAGIGVWAWRSPLGVVPAIPATSPTAVGLVGTSWLATAINGQQVVADPAGDVPSLTFITDLHGVGGQPCNDMDLNYAIDGSRIEFKGLSTHNIGCGSTEIADQQQRFSDALLQASRFRRQAEDLELLGTDQKVVLRFSSTAYRGPSPSVSPPASSTAALTGMKWVAAELRGTATSGGELAWLELSTAVHGHGDVRGSDGCHPMLGNFESSADFINLTGWDRIIRPCGSAQHQQQQIQFVDALDSVTRFQVSGTSLSLLNADGLVVIRFTGVPAPVIPAPDDPTSPAEPTSTRIFTPDPNAEENQVHDYPQVRYRNDSTVTFDTVLVKWSDGGSDSAGIDIQPGQYSGYAEMGYVRINPYVRVGVKGRQYEYNPPSPGRKLARGNVTYVLDIVDGKLTVIPEVQD